MIGTIFLSLLLSYIASCKNGMTCRSWYHEILLCGVDKLSMSITSLSNKNPAKRSCWMFLFEFYFAFCIKFLNPALLTYMLFENLALDLAYPYGSDSQRLHVLASICIFITAVLIIGPMFVCDYPEKFEYDVNAEFAADQVFSDALKGKVTTDIQPLNTVNITKETKARDGEIELNNTNMPMNKPNQDEFN